MLDPGRYLAEAIYFLQYTLAQIMWAINRAILSIAIIAESINAWVTDNVGYFLELLVNALSAPLGGMFILALTALGFWYALNNVVPTGRWVDPSKLFTYGLIAFFFFSSPIVVIEMMEDLRQSLNAGIDQALIDGAAGDIFATSMNGTDHGLPGAIPDVNSDSVIGSFDLVAAFMLVANMDELDSSEFPVDFEAAFFPFGDPTSINLSDEADQQLAKALASAGIERLLFALVAIPTAIAEHFLRLALTGVAMFLYAGVPIAMLFAFFIYTQAFLGAYLRQFINLLIETLMSVIIVSIMIGLLVAAAQQGIGLYIGASIIAFIVILWRIKSAMKLGTAAFDLFGGAMLSGGSGGMELARMGRQAVVGTAALAGAALTGGATVAAGGAVLASAAAVRADGNQNGAYLGTDPEKTDGRVRQLKTIAGYTLGRSESVRHVIENAHEARTLVRNFRDGEVQAHEPDMLDYMRAGSSMSGFGSSPWLAMRTSPSLRAAFDQIGGSRPSARDAAFDGDGDPVVLSGVAPGRSGHGNGRSVSGQYGSTAPEDDSTARLWQDEPATPRQLATLRRSGIEVTDTFSRGQASDLIAQVRNQQNGLADSGGRDPLPNHDLLNRFASLEQALQLLTQALTNPETAVQSISRSSERATNGPLPDWLREDGAAAPDRDRVGDVHSVSAAPDPATSSTPLSRSGQVPDRDSQEDKHKIPSTAASGAVHREPVIRLEPYQDARRQVIHDTLARLAEPHSLAGQAAHKTLVHYTGAHNAALIETAVAQHSVTAVQAAMAATADRVTHYRQLGLSDAAQLAAFQSGDATAAIRETSATLLSDAQLAAVADMVLLPQRRLTRAELVAVIGQEAAAGAADEQAVAQAIGMGPAVVASGFGGQTGNVRGVLAGAQAMELSPAELARLAEMIQDGLRDVVQAELVGRGYPATQVYTFISDMAALPDLLVAPQTTAVAPKSVGPTVVEGQQPLEE
ncbi:MAG: hypothetical protein IPM39_27945 [Chloroflexi bacterium]|nr:hypothetical protein [Chloroflexota bacterium]